jgi:hypothetical protein
VATSDCVYRGTLGDGDDDELDAFEGELSDVDCQGWFRALEDGTSRVSRVELASTDERLSTARTVAHAYDDRSAVVVGEARRGGSEVGQRV